MNGFSVLGEADADLERLLDRQSIDSILLQPRRKTVDRGLEDR